MPWWGGRKEGQIPDENESGDRIDYSDQCDAHGCPVLVNRLCHGAGAVRSWTSGKQKRIQYDQHMSEGRREPWQMDAAMGGEPEPDPTSR